MNHAFSTAVPAWLLVASPLLAQTPPNASRDLPFGRDSLQIMCTALNRAGTKDAAVKACCGLEVNDNPLAASWQKWQTTPVPTPTAIRDAYKALGTRVPVENSALVKFPLE